MNQYLINEKYKLAKKIEPDVTKDMKAISRLCRLRLADIKKSLKSKKSYVRKVKTKMVKEDLSQREAQSEIKDLIRYTLMIDKYEENKTEAVINEIAVYLERMGYKFLTDKSRNYFKNPKSSGYEGYHIYFKTKEGITAEIQVHTEATRLKKLHSHKHYKIFSTLCRRS